MPLGILGGLDPMTYLLDGPAGAGGDRTTAADARHQTAVGSGFKDQCIYM